jgi:hypothetical protein
MMNPNARLTVLAGVFLLAIAGVPAYAVAQQAQTSATPAPQTFMDQEYDGRLHLSAAPYVWLPSIKATTTFSVPEIGHRKGETVGRSVDVGPADYLSKLNSALMFSFGARQGDVSLFGDYININASSNATVNTSFSGPLGHVQIPASFSVDGRIATSIWELAAAVSLAHGHNADLNVFTGVRDFPLNVTLGYNATVGKNGYIAPSGTVTGRVSNGDVILGLEGKAYYGDGHWYTPYYVDLGAGTNNNSWQAYTGAGYTFNHGQSILAVWRSLNYDQLPPDAVVRKLTMGGPLIGYQFGI